MLDSDPTISLWDMRCYMPFPASFQPPLVQQEPLTPAQLYQSLSNLVVRFVASLTTNGTGCLAQIWAPSVADDGGVILSTQVIMRLTADALSDSPSLPRRSIAACCSSLCHMYGINDP